MSEDKIGEDRLDLELNSNFIEQQQQQHEESQQDLQQHQSLDSLDTVKECKLKKETIYKLVDHSIGLIALDCGYHTANQCSLDILGDICCDYLTKISVLLRTAHDTEEWRDSESDFVDSLERVFHQINIPSVANLHQFICKMDAIKKHKLKQALQQTTCDSNLSSATVDEQ